MPIKHLVISGGGPIAFSTIACIQHLEQNGVWKLDEIETIYATSAGGIVAAILCCKYDWETINTYLLKRPWQEAYPITAEQLLNIYTNKGLFDARFTEIMFKPLLEGKNLSLDISLLDFYKYSNIEIHFFSMELNSFTVCDISYKTHPDLQLVKALHMTCAIPILFAPVCFEGKCYIDGGIVTNYPLDNCLQEHSNVDEILAFKNKYCLDFDNVDEEHEYMNPHLITEESNMFELVISFLGKMVGSLSTEKKQTSINNQIEQITRHMSIDYISRTLESEQYRKDLFDKGTERAKTFLKNRL